MTQLSANCGCGWFAQQSKWLSATEVLQAAENHTKSTTHTCELRGIVRMQK